MTKKKTESVITLDTPIKRGDSLIKEITIIKPQSGAYRGVSLSDLLNMDVNALFKVLPRVTSPSLTEHELTTLIDSADLVQMGAELVSFLLPKSAITSHQG